MTQRFDFDFSRDVQRWNRLFAVNSRSAYLLVDDGDLIAHFGPWTLTTTVNNIVDATITGPYRLWRVAGPARLSLTDRGLTFATTTRTGLCLTFRSPVPGIDPLGIFRHPNLTVTVKDPRALATALGFTHNSTTTDGYNAPSVRPIARTPRRTDLGPWSFRTALALESSMAWLAVVAGAVVVLAALLLPRFATRSSTITQDSR